ncbi:hypothetical protein [Nocardia sp. NPDC050435]|uniref:hypothetical protein n=1 Tax=Nocardia sp. NPDC050435 TaxID=3155040 RepID=UPI0033D69CA2
MTSPASPPASPAPEPHLHLATESTATAAAQDALVAKYRAAARADNTLRAYNTAWHRFENWCAANSYNASPAEPVTVLRYLAEAADAGTVANTLGVWRAAIAHRHLTLGWPDPTADASVREVMAGVRDSESEAGIEEKRATEATAEMIRSMALTAHESAETWKQQVAARRDIAVMVALYAGGGRRRSEIAKLTVEDLTVVDDDPDHSPLLSIRLRGGKTHRGSIEYVYRPRGTGDPLVCLWCALARWLAVVEASDRAVARARTHGAGSRAVTSAASSAVQKLLATETDPHVHCCEGDWIRGNPKAPVLRPLDHTGLPDPDRGLAGQSVGSVMEKRAAAAGFDDITGHSARAGLVGDLRAKKVPFEDIMALTGHKTLSSLLRYDRRAQRRSGEIDTGL